MGGSHALAWTRSEASAVSAADEIDVKRAGKEFYYIPTGSDASGKPIWQCFKNNPNSKSISTFSRLSRPIWMKHDESMDAWVIFSYFDNKDYKVILEDYSP